ncbi:MAG: hypothetical protein ACIALR_15125, partial [Blastopirellula sp. JB062]
ETAVVKHGIVGNCNDRRLRFSIGGRDVDGDTHNWDGLIDDVRLTDGALAGVDQIMINTPNDLVSDNTFGMWRFVRSAEQGPLADLHENQRVLEVSPRINGGTNSPHMTALIDYCHVLLNSSEFQFVD